jgi:dienelactone hydrolase
METHKSSLKAKIRQQIQQVWQLVRPDQRAYKGANIGIWIAGLLVALATGMALGPETGPWRIVTFIALGGMITLLAFLSGALVDLIITLINRIPASYRLVLLGFSIVLGLVLTSGGSMQAGFIFSGSLVLAASLFGAGGWALLQGGWRDQSPLRRGLSLGGLVLGAAGLLGWLLYFNWHGPILEPAPNAAAVNTATIPLLQVADPSQPGPFPVKTLAYGSGDDLRRPEFAGAASLVTGRVDGSAFIDNWRGLTGILRTTFWGFDASNLPLNGRVWYPEGEGPFPLALIVHGNHNMMHYSDPGYDYLGELLASRGIILVSVDQNFFNSSWTDLTFIGMKGLQKENDARGWLLLEHLRQWEQWDTTTGNPFFGKVDLDRIAVMGHSRGGEAAAIAAAFNRLPYYPDNAEIALDYQYNIRSVVAIAPSDAQYMPGERLVPLENLNYFTIQGSYDGDVRPFMGLRQYSRVSFTDGGDWFKAAVLVDRANHGQFNTTWGRSDYGGFPGYGTLHLTPILPEEQQLQVSLVYITAFLEATLHNRQEYLPLFQDARAGRYWLPDTIYLSQYAHSSMALHVTYEEDLDLTTGTSAGVRLFSEGLDEWREKFVTQKFGNLGNAAVYLGWDSSLSSSVAKYRIQWTEAAPPVTGASKLVFSLADGGSDYEDPLDLTVTLVDQQGLEAQLPLSHFAPLQPQIEFYHMKARLFHAGGYQAGEPVFQTFFFPLADFVAVQPAFDPERIAELRLVFDRSPQGLVVLDDVGFTDG